MTLARVGLKELMTAHANALAEVEQDEAEWNEAGDGHKLAVRATAVLKTGGARERSL
jgi:hypothetical protein